MEDSLTHELEGVLPAQSTKAELLARIGKYGAQVGREHHGDEDTLMVCALALGVGFFVLKVCSTFEAPHTLCESKGSSGERFALLFDSTIPHWSGKAAAGEAGGGVGAVYFFNCNFLSNAHPCQIDCTYLKGGGAVTLFSVDAAFNYMKAQFFGDWDSASRILATNSPTEVNSIGGAVSVDFGTQNGWDRRVEKETMLRALQKKFLRGGGLASELAQTGECPLALASQTDLVWGIGCSVLDAALGMLWVGQNLLGELLQEVRHGLRRRRRPKKAETGRMCGCPPLCPIGERSGEAVECEGCKMEFGCFSVAIEHEEACPAYPHFLADQAQQVDAAVDAAVGAATVGATATGGELTHIVKSTGKTPSIRDSGLQDRARAPRISRKGGTAVGMKRGADLAGLPATSQPKEQKDRVHAKVDLKGGDSVLVRWGNTSGKNRSEPNKQELALKS